MSYGDLVRYKDLHGVLVALSMLVGLCILEKLKADGRLLFL